MGGALGCVEAGTLGFGPQRKRNDTSLSVFFVFVSAFSAVI